MIFFGTRASNIRNGQIINVDCPNCQTNTSMKYSVFAKYVHVYWIPFFPTSKMTVAECNSCKKTFEYIELVDAIKKKFERIKESNPVRYPIWMFSGLFVIAGIMGFGYYDSKKDEANTAEYIKNPKVGDIYYQTISEGHYTTSRVDKVSRTELFLTNNDYEIDQSYDIDKIDEDKNYTNSKDTITILQMQDFYKNKNITEIIRKE